MISPISSIVGLIFALSVEIFVKMSSFPKHSVLLLGNLGLGLRIIILQCAMVKWCRNASGLISITNNTLQLQNVIITGGKNETVSIYFPYTVNSLIYHYPFNAASTEKVTVYRAQTVIKTVTKYFNVRRYNEETDELRITGWDSSVVGTYVFHLFREGGDPAVELTYLESDPVCGTNVGTNNSSETSFSLPSHTRNVRLYCSVIYVGNLVPTNGWEILNDMNSTAIHVVNYTPRTVKTSGEGGIRGLTFLVDLDIPQTLVPTNYSCESRIFFNQQSISHSLTDEDLIFSQEIASFRFNWSRKFAVSGTEAERRFSVTDVSRTTSGIYDDANKLWMLVAFIVLAVIFVVALLCLVVVSVRIRNKQIRRDAERSQQRSLSTFNIDSSYEELIILSDSSKECLHKIHRVNDIYYNRPSVTTPKSAKVQVVQQAVDTKHPGHPLFPVSEGQPYDYDTIDNVLCVHDIVKGCGIGLPLETDEVMLHMDAMGYETFRGNADDGPVDSMERIKSQKTMIHPDIFPAQYENMDRPTVKPIKKLTKTKDYVNVPKARSCTRQNLAILSLRHLTVPQLPTSLSRLESCRELNEDS